MNDAVEIGVQRRAQVLDLIIVVAAIHEAVNAPEAIDLPVIEMRHGRVLEMIAEEIADKIGIINQGKLLHLGTVGEIKALHDNPGSLEEVFLAVTSENGGEPAP